MKVLLAGERGYSYHEGETMITNRVEEYQQSFIPEGWVNIDRSQNRFLHSTPKSL